VKSTATTEVKNTWSYIRPLSIDHGVALKLSAPSVFVAWYLVKHRTNLGIK